MEQNKDSAVGAAITRLEYNGSRSMANYPILEQAYTTLKQGTLKQR